MSCAAADASRAIDICTARSRFATRVTGVMVTVAIFIRRDSQRIFRSTSRTD
jgi:hypothetical protein